MIVTVLGSGTAVPVPDRFPAGYFVRHEGSAVMIGMAADYDFSERWYTGISLDYVEIDTDGTQRQEFYAGEDAGYAATIDQEITSTQTLVGFEVGFRF